MTPLNYTADVNELRSPLSELLLFRFLALFLGLDLPLPLHQIRSVPSAALLILGLV